MSQPEVYLNGSFVPYEQATVHVEDRGFLFADGVYEVIRVYDGKPFALNDHFDRLGRSAEMMRIPLPGTLADLRAAALETLARSGEREATIYVQVTRGHAGPRTHGFPKDPRPTVFMIARAATPTPERLRAEGARLVSTPDRRWEWCHVKSTGLFLNALARQDAQERGVDDALFVRGNVVTECSSSNFAAVWDGTLHTHPEGRWILPGITRRYVLMLAREAGIPVVEEPFTLDQALAADEAFYTGTTSEVTPVVEIDGQRLGDGRPGAITRRLAELYAQKVHE